MRRFGASEILSEATSRGSGGQAETIGRGLNKCKAFVCPATTKAEYTVVGWTPSPSLPLQRHPWNGSDSQHLACKFRVQKKKQKKQQNTCIDVYHHAAFYCISAMRHPAKTLRPAHAGRRELTQ